MTRQSNFELLRLVAMLMVMACHANGSVRDAVLVGAPGISKLAINQLCLVNVNVFVMISGWFGIRASWKGAAKLLFQVYFLTLLCYIVFAVSGLPVSFKNDLLPYLYFGSGYWFVISYLVLYALTPILNSFLEHTTKKEFTCVLAAFFLAEFLFGFVHNIGAFNYGFSPLYFIGLYLLARYVRIYPLKWFSFRKETDLAIYLIVSILSMIGFWFGKKWFGMDFHLNHYDSPLAIIASLYFLLFFSKLQFQSKAVNWLATSAFAIYLIHTNSLVHPYFQEGVSLITRNHSLMGSLGIMPFFLIAAALLCILIDKLRILAWSSVSSFFSRRFSNNANVND